MLASKPPMGFNTWNTFGWNISEKLVMECADVMRDTGLIDAGYRYLVVDDCWSEKLRDPKTHRLVPSREKFPHGMKALADYVHDRGLLFGMYSCDGVRTCGDYPGSFDHEFLDARTFAEWGVDFLKYDNCYRPGSADQRMLYARMGMALRASGREILYSACNWGQEESWTWIRSTGAHMYRSTGDIFDNAESYRNIVRSQTSHFCASAPGCFNDMDMLTVGMFGKGLVGTTGCTGADYRSQFSLWCMCSAPLMLGCDIRNINPSTYALITNRALIAIDQDEEARPPIFLGGQEDSLVCLKFLSEGYALGLYNFSEEDRELHVLFEDAGLPFASGYGLRLRDVFTGEDAGCHSEYFRVSVPAHDCRVYRAALESV